MITRPLLATYIVTSEQNPFGILISQPNNIRKWVVEKFYGISPGLMYANIRLVAFRLVYFIWGVELSYLQVELPRKQNKSDIAQFLNPDA